MKASPGIRCRAVAAALLGLAAASCAIDTSVQAARNDTLFSGIHPGATREEVQAIAGAPDNRMRFAMSGNEGWDYRYQDGWGYMAIYSVTFSPDGHVLSTISNRINSGGDHH